MRTRMSSLFMAILTAYTFAQNQPIKITMPTEGERVRVGDTMHMLFTVDVTLFSLIVWLSPDNGFIFSELFMIHTTGTTPLVSDHYGYGGILIDTFYLDSSDRTWTIGIKWTILDSIKARGTDTKISTVSDSSFLRVSTWNQDAYDEVNFSIQKRSSGIRLRQLQHPTGPITRNEHGGFPDHFVNVIGQTLTTMDAVSPSRFVQSSHRRGQIYLLRKNRPKEN